MIGDVIQRSLTSPRVLIPVEELLGNCEGGRIPEVLLEALTDRISRRIAEACPTGALSFNESEGRQELALNYGECIGCLQCVGVGEGAVRSASKFSACGVRKSALVQRWDLHRRIELASEEPALSQAAKEIRTIVGRALNIRQVDAGSCNGCEGEIVALTNPYYDLERFGIHFVASPKHADMLLVTGPVTRNMAMALKNTYEATPSPKLVLAVGTCGCSGGIFADSHAVVGSVDKIIPVDGYVPGCPPTPSMLLTGILQVLRQR